MNAHAIERIQVFIAGKLRIEYEGGGEFSVDFLPKLDKCDDCSKSGIYACDLCAKDYYFD